MSLLKTAARVARVLEAHRIRYFILGGLALQYWGEPRATYDVDVTVLVPENRLRDVIELLTEHFRPRVADAAAFAIANRVLLLETADGVPIDVSLGIPGYEEDAYRHAVVVQLPGLDTLRLVGPEDLIIHKCVAGRARDVEDVESVLVRQRLKLDIDRIRSWLEAFREVVSSHDPLELFDRAYARAERKLAEAGER